MYKNITGLIAILGLCILPIQALAVSPNYIPHLRTDQRHYNGGGQPLVITLAGSLEDGLDGSAAAIGEQLAREIGAVTASIDLPAHGTDSANRGSINELGALSQWANRINSGNDLVGEFIVELRSLVNALTPPRSTWVDPTRIVLVGVSRGGFLALHAAANGIGTEVIAVMPVTSLGALSEFQSPVSLVNHPYVLQNRLVVSGLNARRVPIYIIAGHVDPRVDTQEAVRFWDALKNLGLSNGSDMRLVESQGHALTNESLRYQEAAAWIKGRWSPNQPPPPPPSQTPCPLPTIISPLSVRGTVGQPFSYTITPTTPGVTSTTTWFSLIGTLPDGLWILPSTGVISGTPTEAITMTRAIRAANDCGIDQENLVITINPTSPNPPAPVPAPVAPPGPAPTPGITPPPGPAPVRFNTGARIAVTSNLKVRTGPSLTSATITVKIPGKSGTIVSAPRQVDGILWWQINYDDNVVGWSADAFLTPAGSSANPVSPPSLSTFSSFTRNLRYGAIGDRDVMEMQRIFQKEGIYSGPQNGNFYNLTLQAVKNFQVKYSIQSTGYVGPLTRAKLNELLLQYPN